MLAKKNHYLIVLIMLGASLLSSGASKYLQESDAIGRLPDIIVTAPRYVLQDTAWSGMLEEVVVEARRPSTGINSIQSTAVHFSKPIFLATLITLLLVTLSIMFISLRAYFMKQEVYYASTKYRSKKT